MKEYDFTSIGQFINDYKKLPDDFPNHMNALFVKLNEKIKKVETLNLDFSILDDFLFNLKNEFLDKLTSLLSYVVVYKNTKHPHNELLIKLEALLLKNIKILNFEEYLVYKQKYDTNTNILEKYRLKIKTDLIEFRYDIITMHDIWVND